MGSFLFLMVGAGSETLQKACEGEKEAGAC
jgi:hypothetical protein